MAEKLPAELRLRVYEDLVFHPQILRVSKLIYKEAKPVLDRQDSVTTLLVDSHWVGMTCATIRVNGGPSILLPQGKRQVSTMIHQLSTWPQEIISASHISIKIKDNSATPWVLYQLASVIGDNQVEVCIRAQDIVCGSWTVYGEEKVIQDGFWSLMHMGPRAEVTLQGFRSSAVQKLSQEFGASASTRTNVLKYKQLIEELGETIDLAKGAGVPAFSLFSLAYTARNATLGRALYAFDPGCEASLGTHFESLQHSVTQYSDHARVKARALSILAAQKA